MLSPQQNFPFTFSVCLSPTAFFLLSLFTAWLSFPPAVWNGNTHAFDHQKESWIRKSSAPGLYVFRVTLLCVRSLVDHSLVISFFSFSLHCLYYLSFILLFSHSSRFLHGHFILNCIFRLVDLSPSTPLFQHYILIFFFFREIFFFSELLPELLFLSHYTSPLPYLLEQCVSAVLSTSLSKNVFKCRPCFQKIFPTLLYSLQTFSANALYF